MRVLICSLVIAACGGNAAPEKTAPVAPAPPAAPALRSFDRTLHAATFNGTRLTYRVVGDSGATPVVFVHGSLADYRSWNAQEIAFAQRYRVLVYSLRYHPPNPQTEDNQTYSPKLHAEDLAAMLLTLDLAPAHIVGSGYGSYVALALALDHPQLVRSLVLAEPPIFPLLTGTEAGDSARRAFYTNSFDPARAAFTHRDSVAGIRIIYDALHGPGRFDQLPPASRADLLAHAFELRQEMLASREQYFPIISCAELSRITTPILLVRGDRTPRMFQLVSDELARCLQNDTTATIPGAGYPVHLGNPGYYNTIVMRFLMTH
ncbi:MAG TPA: alpha/beta hydrolase [Gemmatimonadales bacterium]|nr:alpha/beta hydrolase [Gemmatimonadales bacterium]